MKFLRTAGEIASMFSLEVTHAARTVSIEIYEARPTRPARGTVVIIQEIFGVTDHIKSVADRYAALGFRAWAPAFFDVLEKGLVLPYGEEGLQRGIELVGQLGWEWPVEIVKACAARAESPTAVVGFCWGGSVAWLSSARIKPGQGLNACVGYYGSKAPDFKNETPQLPVMLHFGEDDHGIPMEKVRALMNAQPQVPIELYKAGHGFNRDGSSSYNAEAAKLALDKTIAFLVRQGF